jgi:hypothetical protein
MTRGSEPPDGPTALEMLEDVFNLVASVAILLLPLFILAVPGVILLGLVLIPLAAAAVPVALAGAILALPYLLVRSVRRRLRRGLELRAAEGGSPFWG